MYERLTNGRKALQFILSNVQCIINGRVQATVVNNSRSIHIVDAVFGGRRFDTRLVTEALCGWIDIRTDRTGTDRQTDIKADSVGVLVWPWRGRADGQEIVGREMERKRNR